MRAKAAKSIAFLLLKMREIKFRGNIPRCTFGAHSAGVIPRNLICPEYALFRENIPRVFEVKPFRVKYHQLRGMLRERIPSRHSAENPRIGSYNFRHSADKLFRGTLSAMGFRVLPFRGTKLRAANCIPRNDNNPQNIL